ncbi:transmembrane serine protease 8 [Trichuris trichiura]|uniref:Transmembrane serine protease 8 n=1 Tax=Trichuris trichiura TaxID=36087 RepID=A0A077ZGJ7_TRITR|nr:transmembrane serine protease 8 [Trichuris trichiura]
MDSFPCGLPKFPLAQGPNRIGSGWEAAKHSLPWHVHIMIFNSVEEKVGTQCGGSLIRLGAGNISNMVLTAAHCIFDSQNRRIIPPSKIIVTVGVHDVTAKDKTRIQVIDVAMGEYRKDFDANDIALLRLMSGVPYTDYTVPVCLPDRRARLPVGKKCYVSGHGSISGMKLLLINQITTRFFSLATAALLPEKLMMVDINVISIEECRRLIDADSEFDFEKQFCAGTNSKTALKVTRAIQGDSGGALVCHEWGRFIQYGIVSFGPAGIGYYQTAGKYTFLPKFVGWIEKMDKKMLPSKDNLPASSIHEYLTQTEKINFLNKSVAAVAQKAEFFECGVPSPKFPITMSPITTNRISGGWTAQKHSLPWMVLFIAAKENNPMKHALCGGTLIALEPGNQTDTVLTAASCVLIPSTFLRWDPKDCQVAIAVQNQRSPDSERKRIGVKSFVTHPRFVSDSTRNDIAVIRLLHYAPFTEISKPICLPQPGEKIPVGTECIVAGWGYTSRKSSVFAKICAVYKVILEFATLNEADLAMTIVSVAPFSICQEKLEYAIYENEFICTQSEFHRGFCDSDTGGPLVCKSNGKWVQYGLISTVVGRCGKEFDTYTNVSSYIHWIKQADSLMVKASQLFPSEFIREYVSPLENIDEQPRRHTTVSNY